MTTDKRTGIAALLLSAVMMNIAYTMLVPLVPELTGRFQMSALEVAAAFSGFAVAKALTQPIGGILVDRTLRPQLIGFFGMSMTAAAVLGLAFSAAGWQVLAWRLAWGVAEGLTMPVLYQLASSLGASSRFGTARVMGWFGGCCTAGMVLGPAVVGLLHPLLGFTGVFLAGAVVTAAGGVLLLGLRVDRVEVSPSAAAGERWTIGAVRPLILLVAIFAVADLVNNALFAALEPVVPLHLDKVTGNGVAYTSVIYTAGLAVFMVVAMTCAKLVESRPLLVIAAFAFGAEAVGLAAVGLFDGVVAMCAGLLLFMTAQPVLYLVARQGVNLVPRHLLGRAFGAFGLVSDIGFVVGPLLGALAYTGLGISAFFAMAVVAAGAGLGVALLRVFRGGIVAEERVGSPGAVAAVQAER
ncbi:MFS transporter [Micromonospora sp. DR5-3]|uniref:MFS transporter n=1 Tax=unclassified Micromonospora TaxID=2617518 RepID=UPI0011D9E53B|nr:MULTISPECIES: MFS transporter [unclassified Micromonospora]MCW3819865.1 MFS transporter [Micromonospora sp. DR5-3]TYC19909.1 MFS transporter [Micromonospora sp. MP36]